MSIQYIHCTAQYQYNTQYGTISVQHTVLLNISTILSTVQYQYNTLYCTISIQYSERYNIAQRLTNLHQGFMKF